jgi:hypothetical protein
VGAAFLERLPFRACWTSDAFGPGPDGFVIFVTLIIDVSSRIAVFFVFISESAFGAMGIASVHLAGCI